MTQEAEALVYRVNVKFPEIQQQLGDNGTISFPEVGIEFTTTDTATIRQTVEGLAVAMSRTSADEGPVGQAQAAAPAAASAPETTKARKPRTTRDPATASAPPPLAVPSAPPPTPPGAPSAEGEGIPPFLKRDAAPPPPAPAAAAPPPPLPNAPPIAPAPPAAPVPPPPAPAPPASNPALAGKVVDAIKARGPTPDAQKGMVAWLASVEAVVPAATFEEALDCVPLLPAAKVQQIATALGVA